MALSLQSTVKLNSGQQMPRLGFGVYQTPADKAEEVCTVALNNGYRHIDSAAAYKNEAPCATAIKSSDVPRPSIFFTSKIPARKLGYENTKAQIAATLSETQLSFIDLMLIHAPYGGPDARKGAWKALVEAVEEGKINSIGVSNYGVHHLDELEEHIRELEAERGPGGGGILSVGQWEIHPYLPRDDIVEWCRKRNVAVEAYSPIVRGERWGEKPVVEAAERHGVSEAQVLLRWSLQKGYVPLPKSVTHERILKNADLYGFELSEDEVKAITTSEYSPVCWDPTVSKLED